MIQGILNELVDPNTGAILNFHHINNYTVDTKNGNVCLHIGSYVSRKMFDLAKQAIISTSLAITSGTVLYDFYASSEDNISNTATIVVE